MEKSRVPQFNDEELAKLDTLAKDPAIPFHFALQLVLLVKMQKLQFHPRMKSTGKPEHEQLALEWSLCKDLMAKPSLNQDFGDFRNHFSQKVCKRLPMFEEFPNITENHYAIFSNMTTMLKNWKSNGFEAHKKARPLLEANEAVKMLTFLASDTTGHPKDDPNWKGLIRKNERVYEEDMPQYATLLARMVHNYERILPIIKAAGFNTSVWERSFIPLKILLKQSAAFSERNFVSTKMMFTPHIYLSHNMLYDLLIQCGSEPFKNQPSDPTDGDDLNDGEDPPFANNVIGLMVRIDEQNDRRENTRRLTVENFSESVREKREQHSVQWNNLILDVLKILRSQIEITLTRALEQLSQVVIKM